MNLGMGISVQEVSWANREKKERLILFNTKSVQIMYIYILNWMSEILTQIWMFQYEILSIATNIYLKFIICQTCVNYFSFDLQRVF